MRTSSWALSWLVFMTLGRPSPLDKRSSLGFQEVQELSQGCSANRDHAWLPTQVYLVLKLASSQDSAAFESDLNSVQPIPKPTPGWHPLTAPKAKLATDTGFWAASNEWTSSLGWTPSSQGLERERFRLRE